MIYTALQNIRYKHFRNEKIQIKTVSTGAQPYQYLLSARLEVNEKER